MIFQTGVAKSKPVKVDWVCIELVFAGAVFVGLLAVDPTAKLAPVVSELKNEDPVKFAVPVPVPTNPPTYLSLANNQCYRHW